MHFPLSILFTSDSSRSFFKSCLYLGLILGFQLPFTQAQACSLRPYQWALSPSSVKKSWRSGWGLSLGDGQGVNPGWTWSTSFQLNEPIQEGVQLVVSRRHSLNAKHSNLQADFLNAAGEKVAFVQFDSKQQKLFLFFQKASPFQDSQVAQDQGPVTVSHTAPWVRSLELIPRFQNEEMRWSAEDPHGHSIQGYAEWNHQNAEAVYWQDAQDVEGGHIQLFSQRNVKNEQDVKAPQASWVLESWTDDSELHLLWIAALTIGALDQALGHTAGGNQSGWWPVGSGIAVVSLSMVGAFVTSWMGGGATGGACAQAGGSHCHCHH